MNARSALDPPPAGVLHRSRRCALVCMLLGACAAGWAQVAALPAVVVWDFDNQTAMSALPTERIDYLRRALSENLTATLLQVQGLPVVERQRLKDLLAEQQLAAGALAEEDTRLRLGKIVGAQRMVFGGFFVLGDEVQVHVRVVDTASSRVIFSDEATTLLPAVMQQVAAMNSRLAHALGGSAATGTRSHPPELWQSYDRALALADAGDLDAAITALQALLARDKDFTPAERQLVALLGKMARR
ncbi:MAG: CsgG/HfaB family protein [Rubrivivax sp.]|nr:CsgG/HfaB family protein [Rubrivivax sp.]